ncbi:MAG TPA: hypothetical protein VM531_00235 [Sphingomicrobium sp.]|jgi:hypothetical protein|nr:hypothetical protein [Sphingomicrobium sp.]
MSAADKVILLAGLIEIELAGRTVRLCDGGFVNWPARGLFTSQDIELGTIQSLEAVNEAVSDEAPGGRLTLLPPSTVAAADLYQSDAQGNPVRFWLAEVDRDTGLLLADPELLFLGMIDFMTLRVNKGSRMIELEFVAAAERLFFVREGNVLSTRFHQLAWPGEKGFDHATGAQAVVPWGIPGQGRGTVTSGGTIGHNIGSGANVV